MTEPSKAKEIYGRAEVLKASPEMLAVLGELYSHAVELEEQTPIAPEEMGEPYVGGSRLGYLGSFVLGADASPMDLPAQQDCVREIRRLRSALFYVGMHLPANGGAMSASQWNIWLVCERALNGRAELPDYLSAELRQRVVELDDILYSHERGSSELEDES